MSTALIIGAGSTIKIYKWQIKKYIERVKPVLIGVNNVNDLFDLDYNIWTNRSRFKEFFQGRRAKLILSEKLYSRICKEILYGFGHVVDDSIIIDDDIKKWRTAGLRAIQWAYENFFNKIHIIGMDGYSSCYGGNQHFYGTGLTDGQNIEDSQKKDDLIKKNLQDLKKSGIIFNIITPTVYDEFYRKGIL